jgi:L-2,4-diaminobutyrate decarboxylase
MIPAELDAALAAARAADTPILAVVANACATATGLYDPLRAVGEICRRHQVWLHIDGCHGASVLISEKWKHLVDGIELGDSVCWDAHKMLGSSALSAGVLFREPDAVYRSFRQDGNYLGGTEAEETLYLRSVECTKSGLGLRALLVLAMRGEAGLAADLDVMHENARYLNRLLRAADDFEVPLDPESNILLFRPLPQGQELSDTQVEAVRRGLADAGSYYLTAANFAGRKWLRVTLMNPATSHAHLREMAEEVRQKALAIVAESAVEDVLP